MPSFVSAICSRPLIPPTILRILTVLMFLSMLQPTAVASGMPSRLEDAKLLLREHVYFDQQQNQTPGTLYCGCRWQWIGSSGGRVDLASCGYQIRSRPERAKRIEWEHVVPASWLGSQRQCWQQGGRDYCRQNDPLFARMEADLHNLAPVIGEVNADRSNFRMGMAPRARAMYGRCSSKTDFGQRIFEPRREARGSVARIYFYMHDRYNLKMSQQQQKLFMQWHLDYPVSAWERERNQRIQRLTGVDNPYVSGQRQWQLNPRNSGAGLIGLTGATGSSTPAANASVAVKGNRNSKLYHLPHCPNFADVSPRNSVPFKSEHQAQQAGYRKARNCRQTLQKP